MANRPAVGLPKLSRRSKILIGIGVLVLLALILGNRVIDTYVDWLWFGEVGYRGVFSTIVVTRIVLFFAVGAFIGGLVALAMVIAGAARRRSGWLAFLTIALLVPALISAVVPRDASIVLGSTNVTLDRSRSIIQPGGSLVLRVDRSTIAAAGTPRLELTQAAGHVQLELLDGARLRIDATVRDGQIDFYTVDAAGEMTFDHATELGAASDRWTGIVGEASGSTRADAELVVRAANTDITVVTYEENAR